jgi:N-succinyldiaminopimelate aminotransferase
MTVSGAWERAARGAMLLGDDGDLKTTIFAEMSALATSTGAINLGQGFPDEDGPEAVLEAARQAITSGVNQYPPGRGMPVLREAIAEHQRRFYGIELDADREILVTVGATEALSATILALTNEGDEIVTFEPFYDSYAAMIGLSRATHVTVGLRAPQFQPDLDELRAAVTDRTRIILINNPHNPTGTVLSEETLACIVELAHQHNAIIVSDEVYEHLTFGVPHIPICTLPGARERTVTISSGGKTFNTTGWKIGWLSAPADIVDAILAVKQYLTFVGGAPFQPAIAVGLALPDSFFTTAAATLGAKRDMLSAGLATAGFTVFSPQGGYFVLVDAAPLGFPDAAEFCRQLPALAGVVGIPVTAFVREDNRSDYRSLVRFAYCKRVNILTMASAQLAALSARS